MNNKTREITDKDIQMISTFIKMMTDADVDVVEMLNKIMRIQAKLEVCIDELMDNLSKSEYLIMSEEKLLRYKRYLSDLIREGSKMADYVKDNMIYNPMIKDMVISQLKYNVLISQHYKDIFDAVEKTAIII